MTRRAVAVVVAVFALAGTGCAGTARPAAERSDAHLAVPDLGGATLRDATCRLTDMHLRWRVRGQRHATTRPLSGCGSDGVGSSMDTVRVTGQTPAPGTRVRRGTVIVLDDQCTDSVRSGGGACA